MRIEEFLHPSAIISQLNATTRDDVLREIAECLTKQHPELASLDIFRLLRAREELSSTAMEGSLAIPHAKVPRLERMYGAFGRSEKGIPFSAPDGSLSHLFFVLLSPERNSGGHLMALASISRIFRDESRRQALLAANNSAEIFRLLQEN